MTAFRGMRSARGGSSDSGLAPHVSRAIATVIRRGLSLDPSARFPSANAFGNSLWSQRWDGAATGAASCIPGMSTAQRTFRPQVRRISVSAPRAPPRDRSRCELSTSDPAALWQASRRRSQKAPCVPRLCGCTSRASRRSSIYSRGRFGECCTPDSSTHLVMSARLATIDPRGVGTWGNGRAGD